MARPEMRLQFKLGQCVASVLEDVSLRRDDEIAEWFRNCVTHARLTIREAERASRKERT